MALHALAPAGAVVVTGRLDDPRWVADAAPADLALASGHTAVRRSELLAGRGCLREALAELGHGLASDETVASRPDRGPDWPAGVAGSLAHAAGEVAVVVARETVLDALGVDVEVAVALSEEVVTLVAGAPEVASALSCGLGGLGASVVFSAKEAVYKAWAPRGGWLEHDDVRVDLRADGSARAEVSTPDGRHGTFTLGWEVDAGVVRCLAWRGVAQ